MHSTSLPNPHLRHLHHPTVVAYFDVDCFYAQSEILRRPHLRHSPVGVTQKSLVVTCNYVARELGVPKMASIQEAKQRCPNLVLFNGEDLTPYRTASKHIMAVIGRFGVLERRGLDEAALDITSEVLKRTISMPTKYFSGHVIGLEVIKESETDCSLSHPRNYGDQNNMEIIEEDENDCKFSLLSNSAHQNNTDYYIMVGSQIVAEIRVAVEKETGFQCSSGIASNKMLAKMVSSINKPNKQTCILNSAVSTFLKPLHVRKLPGVGHQTEALLNDMGVTTLADLQQISLQQLATRFGSRMGTLLYENCRGVDNSLVQNKGPPKSLSVEDSFQPCSSFKQAECIVKRLAADLIVRLDEDKGEHARRPNVITVKWRYSGSWSFKSASTSMPLEVVSNSIPMENRVDIVVLVAIKLLMNAIKNQPFSLVVLNIGATNFVSNPCEGNGASRDIRSFLKDRMQVFKYVSKVVTNCETQAFQKDYGNLHLPSILSNTAKNYGDNVHTQGEVKLDIEEQFEDESVLQEKATSTQTCATFTSHLGKMDNGGIEVGEILTAVREEDKKISTIVLNENLPGNRTDLDQSIEYESVLQAYATFTSHRGRMGNGGVEVDEVLTAEVEEKKQSAILLHENLPGNGALSVNNKGFGGLHQFICEKCGQELDDREAQTRQEHDDYHLALDLNLQEQESNGRAQSIQAHEDYCFALDLNSQQRIVANSITEPSMHLSTKGKHKKLKYTSKRKRIQNATLDCFVYRTQH